MRGRTGGFGYIGRPWMNRMGSGEIMRNLMNEVLQLTRFSGFL